MGGDRHYITSNLSPGGINPLYWQSKAIHKTNQARLPTGLTHPLSQANL